MFVFKARHRLVEQLMSTEKHELREEDLMEIAKLSEGYSGADMKTLCADATMGPVRSIDMRLIQSIRTEEACCLLLLFICFSSSTKS